MIGHIGSKEPIIAAIAEEVTDGHSRMRETMD